MRWPALALAVSTSGALSSCALVLDFDDLTKGDGRVKCTTNAGCDDGNPCTEDNCDGATGFCEFTPHVLVRVGQRSTLSGDIGRAFRLSMTATGTRYFLSVFYETPSKTREVGLYHWDVGALDASSVETPPLSQRTNLVLTNPASLASLVTSDTTPPAIHAYVAAGQPPTVFHLVMDEALALQQESRQAETDSSYDASSATRGPVAWRTDSGVWGAWITPSGGIFIHGGNAPIPAGTPPTITPSPGATLLAPLGATTVPGVTWMSDAGSFARLQNGAGDLMLSECHAQGTPVSLGSAPFVFQNGWLTIWTRDEGAAGPTLESGLVACDDSGSCTQPTPNCSNDPSPTRPGVRNATLQFFKRESKPSSGYQFAALPEVDAARQEGAMRIRLREIDVGSSTSTELELREISRTKLGGGAAGPDWPVVGVAREGELSVAWIEPGADARDVVQWERYRVCYPDASP
ncbi:MAG: hypothetical protein R3B13_09825 [Polyangiaceae bacterium]